MVLCYPVVVLLYNHNAPSAAAANCQQTQPNPTDHQLPTTNYRPPPAFVEEVAVLKIGDEVKKLLRERRALDAPQGWAGGLSRYFGDLTEAYG